MPSVVVGGGGGGGGADGGCSTCLLMCVVPCVLVGSLVFGWVHDGGLTAPQPTVTVQETAAATPAIRTFDITITATDGEIHQTHIDLAWDEPPTDAQSMVKVVSLNAGHGQSDTFVDIPIQAVQSEVGHCRQLDPTTVDCGDLHRGDSARFTVTIATPTTSFPAGTKGVVQVTDPYRFLGNGLSNASGSRDTFGTNSSTTSSTSARPPQLVVARRDIPAETRARGVPMVVA